MSDRIQSGCGFLEKLYSPSIGLVRTTVNSTVYYLASDNILAARALSICSTPTSNMISQNITITINHYCKGCYDHKHEILLGVRIPLPIHDARVYSVANLTGPAAILWEVSNATTVPPDCAYADLVAYTALELNMEKNTTGTQHEMSCLSLMYDGRGLVDEPYKLSLFYPEHGVYQTYKLALYLYTSHNISSAFFYNDADPLLRMQGPDGGFHTGYDSAGTYSGTQENTETTAIAIITLNSLNNTFTPFPLFPSIPSWTIYAVIAAVAAGGAVILLVYLLVIRKRPAVPKQT